MAYEENYKSVKWVLLSLNLCDYTRVSIREHLPGSTNYLGGGKPGDVIQRFGDRLVADSCIQDNVLCLYVLPLDQQLSDRWGDWCMIGNRFCACPGCCSSCTHSVTVVDMSCPLDR